MKRLSLETFGSFVGEANISAIMFGSPTGDATRDQAIEFADAWTRRGDVSFGYVDAFEQVALARSFSIRVLPTTLVLRDGEVVARYEGRHHLSALRLEHDLNGANLNERTRAARGRLRSRDSVAVGPGKHLSELPAAYTLR